MMIQIWPLKKCKLPSVPQVSLFSVKLNSIVTSLESLAFHFFLSRSLLVNIQQHHTKACVTLSFYLLVSLSVSIICYAKEASLATKSMKWTMAVRLKESFLVLHDYKKKQKKTKRNSRQALLPIFELNSDSVANRF